MIRVKYTSRLIELTKRILILSGSIWQDIGLLQDRSNPSALAKELLRSYTKPLVCDFILDG